MSERRLGPWLGVVAVVLGCGSACQGGGGATVGDAGADAADASGGSDAQDGDIGGTECPSSELQPGDDGLALGAATCPDSLLRFLPWARIAGAWVGGGQDGACLADATSVRCPAGPAGWVVAERLGSDTVQVHFEADQAVQVEALELRGAGQVEGARGWLSDGFQSWSETGVLALGPPPDAAALDLALQVRGDDETLRGGRELSWFYTVVGGGPHALVAGALSAEVFRPWAQASRGEDGGLALRLVAGATGESVPVAAGETASGPPWLVSLGSDLEAQLTAYGQRLPHRASRVAPQAGWNSWYELWDGVDEQAVRDNAALARQVLEPRLPPGAPPLRIVVDDGWERLWGEWEPNDRFPSGLDGLAADLRQQGFTMGVWMAPLLVDEDSALVAEHPDWFVGGAVYPHLSNGPMRVLDVTQPEAAAHLQSVIRQVVGWGYDFLKIDFLFAGTYEGQRAEPVTGMQAYARALSLIREAAGEDVTLLAVGAPPVATFAYVDGWRVGPDIALVLFGVSWPFIPNQARSLAGRWPLCLAVQCDADPVLLRELPQNEVEAGAWVVGLSGGALFLSDDLRALPEERRGWGLDPGPVGLALSGAPSVPEDYFPEGDLPTRLVSAPADYFTHTSTQVVPRLWRTAAGFQVAFNAGDEPVQVDGVEVAAHSAVRLDNPP